VQLDTIFVLNIETINLITYSLSYFCAVPSAAIQTSVNNILMKTSLNGSSTTVCGPLCPSIRLHASWQHHSGTASQPMSLVHVECSSCPISIGQENVLALELLTRCAQVWHQLC